MIKETLKSLLEASDSAVVKAGLKLRTEKNSVIIFLFHGVFRNESEISLNHVDPQQGFTLDHYRSVIEHFLEAGYRFITPDSILRGLDFGGRYLMLTFDDGYCNNLRMLPLLREYEIPASFFISTGPIEQNKCFWWDVLYRERKKTGNSTADIYREGKTLKGFTNDRIENYLVERFGKDCMKPISDVDRLFTAEELRDFSREENVHIGNHTRDHGILTNYSRAGIRKQIEEAQTSLKRMTGEIPLSIAYPNGNYSETILAIVRDLGFKIGISCDFAKNPVTQKGNGLLRLGRFCFLNSRRIPQQCEMFRSDFSPYLTVKNLASRV